MQKWDISDIYESEEDWRLARTLFRLIPIAGASYLIVAMIAFYYHDRTLTLVTLTGCALLVPPVILIKRRRLRAGSMLVVFLMLGMVTVMATVGHGIHDLAVVGYPIIFIFAGLTLDRALFRLSIGATFVSICWLCFGQPLGWFTPRPMDQGMVSWFDFILTLLTLSVAALAVELLTSNLRKTIEQAKREITQRKLVEEELRHQGTHDALTGIYNRSFFETELTRIELSREFPVSVIIADVDDLKIANDNCGHAIGDEILRQTTSILCSSFRAGDMVARIGGDEFAILLPSTNSSTAEQIVLRIKKHLKEHNAKTPDLKIQLSIGAATARKQNLTKAFAIADKRMYADKASHKSDVNQSTKT